MIDPVAQLLVATIGRIKDGDPVPQKSLLVCGVEFTVIVAFTCVNTVPITNTNAMRYLTKGASRLKNVLGFEANLLLVMFTIFVQGAKILKIFPKKNFLRNYRSIFLGHVSEKNDTEKRLLTFLISVYYKITLKLPAD